MRSSGRAIFFVASAIAGVPASNLYGRSFQVVSSTVTLRIISPPISGIQTTLTPKIMKALGAMYVASLKGG